MLVDDLIAVAPTEGEFTTSVLYEAFPTVPKHQIQLSMGSRKWLSAFTKVAVGKYVKLLPGQTPSQNIMPRSKNTGLFDTKTQKYLENIYTKLQTRLVNANNEQEKLKTSLRGLNLLLDTDSAVQNSFDSSTQKTLEKARVRIQRDLTTLVDEQQKISAGLKGAALLLGIEHNDAIKNSPRLRSEFGFRALIKQSLLDCGGTVRISDLVNRLHAYSKAKTPRNFYNTLNNAISINNDIFVRTERGSVSLRSTEFSQVTTLSENTI
jgi:hypothetical protein